MLSQAHRLDAKRPQRSHPQQQQQAQRPDNHAQQQGGGTPEPQSHERQSPNPEKSVKSEPQMGEGSYEGTRDYQENIKSYLDKADVKSDAEAARPATSEEAQALKKAEDEALSHTKAPGQ
jgi:hypothetical protein